MPEDSDIESFEDDEYDRSNPLAAALEESTPNHYREASIAANRFYTRGIAYVQGHRSNLPLVWDCWLLAMEMYDLLGAESQEELAQRHSVTKQDVCKTVNQILKRIGKEPSPNQRRTTGRKNMSKSRKEQLQ